MAEPQNQSPIKTDGQSKTQLILGFVLVGLFLLGLSYYFSKQEAAKPEREMRLARLERETGKVFVLRSGYTQKENIERRAQLYSLDSIETTDLGEATLSFESAYRVKVLASSLVTLEKIDDPETFHVVVIIKRGDIRVENFGREGELFIAKNGDRVSASDYNSSSLAQLPTAAPTPVDESTAPTPNQTLSEDEIGAVMNSHKTAFFKCYTQLLQKEPQAKGNVSLSFTIENTGKLSVAEVTASQIQNQDFKKCLIEVLHRIEFKSFQGVPVSTLFPLIFE